MKITIKNKLFLQDIPGSLAKTIKGRLTFANPKYLENERMGRWNGEIPEYLKFYEREGNSLIVPRGYIRQLINLCRKNNVCFQFDDQRRILPEVSFSFKGKLNTIPFGNGFFILVAGMFKTEMKCKNTSSCQLSSYSQT